YIIVTQQKTFTMYNIRYMRLLIVLMGIILYRAESSKACPGPGPGKRCPVVNTNGNERYDRMFVFVGEFSGAVGSFPPTKMTTAHEYHRMAGRDTREKIIEAGRKALAFFKCRFGLSPNVSDDELYNASIVNQGDYTFSTETYPISPGAYRLALESKYCKCRVYYYQPEILEISFNIVIKRELKAGGSYGKPLYPGDVVIAGVYMIKPNSKKRCSIEGLVRIPVVAYVPMKPYGASGFVTHPAYGNGTYQSSFVKDNTGMMRVINVIRFPGDTTGVVCNLMYS
ncbi:unnamed protein product, partial [Owenia fusiformis]